jgi:protein-disulfide isomerase
MACYYRGYNMRLFHWYNRNKRNVWISTLVLGVVLLFIFFLYLSTSTKVNDLWPTTSSKQDQNVSKLLLAEVKPEEFVYGSTTAKLVIIEYYDLECPYCRDMHAELKKNKDFLNKIGYVYRPFPLVDLHAGAAEKNLALLCAEGQEQDLFLTAMEYAYQDIEMSPSQFEEFLTKIVPDASIFMACIKSSTYQTVINDSVTKGHALGLYGTPSIIFLYDKEALRIFQLVGAHQALTLIAAFLKAEATF